MVLRDFDLIKLDDEGLSQADALNIDLNSYYILDLTELLDVFGEGNLVFQKVDAPFSVALDDNAISLDEGSYDNPYKVTDLVVEGDASAYSFTTNNSRFAVMQDDEGNYGLYLLGLSDGIDTYLDLDVANPVSELTVTVTATHNDSGEAVSTDAFTLTINAIDEAPTFSDPASYGLSEGSAASRYRSDCGYIKPVWLCFHYRLLNMVEITLVDQTVRKFFGYHMAAKFYCDIVALINTNATSAVLM